MDVVCFPDMEWDHGLWTNRQQIMSRLPGIDPSVRVLYVAPPRFALSGHLGRGRLKAGARTGAGLRQVADRLWVLQPLLPVPNRHARRLTGPLLDRYTHAMTRRAMRRLGMQRPVVWAYGPVSRPERIERSVLVYDVVDDYGALQHYRQMLGDRIVELDRELTREADLVFTTSEHLHAQRRQLNDRVLAVGNAADVELFSRAREPQLAVPPELMEIPHPIIGFHGALASEKIDSRLLVEVATRRPDWTLVLIGPESDTGVREAIAAVPNVRLLGRREAVDLPPYLARFSAAFIPYRRNDYTLGVSALKLAEYLAAGVPVVATDLPGFREHAEWIRIASDASSAIAALEAALSERNPVPLRDLARFSWDDKARRQLDAVRAILDQGQPR